MKEKFLWSFLLRHMSALLHQYKFSIRQCVCQSPCIPRRNQTVCVTCDHQNCTENNPETFLSRMHKGKPKETWQNLLECLLWYKFMPQTWLTYLDKWLLSIVSQGVALAATQLPGWLSMQAQIQVVLVPNLCTAMATMPTKIRMINVLNCCIELSQWKYSYKNCAGTDWWNGFTADAARTTISSAVEVRKCHPVGIETCRSIMSTK